MLKKFLVGAACAAGMALAQAGDVRTVTIQVLNGTAAVSGAAVSVVTDEMDAVGVTDVRGQWRVRTQSAQIEVTVKNDGQSLTTQSAADTININLKAAP
jgi:hypothetical protein